MMLVVFLHPGIGPLWDAKWAVNTGIRANCAARAILKCHVYETADPCSPSLPPALCRARDRQRSRPRRRGEAGLRRLLRSSLGWAGMLSLYAKGVTAPRWPLCSKRSNAAVISETTARSRREESVDSSAELSLLVQLGRLGWPEPGDRIPCLKGALPLADPGAAPIHAPAVLPPSRDRFPLSLRSLARPRKRRVPSGRFAS
jgi:hypothetical protein